MAVKVLLTCVGGGLMPQAIRFLKNSKVHKNTKVYGVDMNPSATGKYFADYFQTVPNGKSKNFINQIIKICRKFKINLIFKFVSFDFLQMKNADTSPIIVNLSG